MDMAEAMSILIIDHPKCWFPKTQSGLRTPIKWITKGN
jgi:hypothetical protein